MLLTFKFDEPAASPNSLVVCWIPFPRKQSFKQENQPSFVKTQQVGLCNLHRVLFSGSAWLLTTFISFVEKLTNVR